MKVWYVMVQDLKNSFSCWSKIEEGGTVEKWINTQESLHKGFFFMPYKGIAEKFEEEII